MNQKEQKKLARQKISYLLCCIGGMWILGCVLTRFDTLNLFSKVSLLFVGVVITTINGYFYIKARAYGKQSKSGQNSKEIRMQLDELNKAYVEGNISTEEYKKISQTLFSKG